MNTRKESPRPLVFVVVLNWNGWQDTLDCLGSLHELNYPNYQIVVVDNASTDNSIERIREKYDSIEIIQNTQNLGFGGGCNTGIQFANERGASYVWLLNNDAIVDSNALEPMVEIAESDLAVGGVGSVIYFLNQPERIQAWGGGHVNLLAGTSTHILAPSEVGSLDYITGASLLLRSDALGEVGVFDESFFMYWEDADLSFRLRSEGWKLAVAERSKVYHKQFGSLGRISVVLDEYFSRSAVVFFCKHSRLPVIPIMIGAVRRLVKRLACGDLDRFLAVWRATWSTWLAR